MDSRNLTIVNCFFSFCDHPEEGGAIYLDDCQDVVIEECGFIFCEVELRGGAVYVADSVTVTLKSNKFFANTAGREGGAIYVIGSTVVLLSDGNSFYGNVARVGGAIAIRSVWPHDESRVRIIGANTFDQNRAEHASVAAGGVVPCYSLKKIRLRYSPQLRKVI